MLNLIKTLAALVAIPVLGGFVLAVTAVEKTLEIWID